MEPKEHLMDWLRDAHAMEMEAVQLLEKQADRLEGYSEMQSRVQWHLEETRRQAERIEGCIERLGGSPSGVKDVAGKAMGVFATMTNAMASDEVVKNVLANYAFENFEIACYKSLIEAARVANDTETARVCEENLHEEMAMASWLEQNLSSVTREFLERDFAGREAKR